MRPPLTLPGPESLQVPQVMGEIEAKSETVREQGREYSRVQSAHEQMAASLAIAQSENRQHASRVNQLEAEARRDANNRRCASVFRFVCDTRKISFKPHTDG